eukprot:scaffold2487_cov98-Skeletonema_dohrnii-CCMP3373.AAC.12
MMIGGKTLGYQLLSMQFQIMDWGVWPKLHCYHLSFTVARAVSVLQWQPHNGRNVFTKCSGLRFTLKYLFRFEALRTCQQPLITSHKFNDSA